MPWVQIKAPDLIPPTDYCLPIQFADTAAKKRTWGPRAKGSAAEITLDKDTFRIGEDVRLHLAVENFDVEGSVYSADPVWDPCDVAGHPEVERRCLYGEALGRRSTRSGPSYAGRGARAP